MRHIEPRERRLTRVQAQADADGGPVQIEIADTRRDVAGIDECRDIDVSHQRHSRFGIDQQQVPIVEAIGGVTAQGVVTAETRLQVEGHGLIAVRIGERTDGPKCEHPIAVGKRDVVLQVHVDPVEVELSEVLIIELCRCHLVPAA